jgi:choline kinase
VQAYPILSDEAVLGVDYDIPRCFDLPDATKVRLDGDRIVGIGKDLATYDALDTGVFVVTPALVAALRHVDGPAGCSLSQGVQALAAAGCMRAVDVGTATWIDVDTPAAHREAERLIRAYGPRLAPASPARVAV